jgi:hypothetical protein
MVRKHVIERNRSEFPSNKNNLLVILIINNRLKGNSGYIEMIPVEELDTGAWRLSADISVKDYLQSNMIEIYLGNSPDVTELSHIRERAERYLLIQQKHHLIS